MEVTVRDGAGGSGGASRTFQSLFGHAAESHGERDARIATAQVARTNGDGERGVQEDKDTEEEGDVWDDDFPSDANMESAEEDNADASDGPGKALSTECRQSMSDWADNDDDEDNWKDALQARVDQLELVVEKKAVPAQPLQLNASLRVDTHAMAPQVAAATIPTATYAPPVDQRATLTLVPKTNLLRSISAPPAAEEHKPASKIKSPQTVRAVTPSAAASGGAKTKVNTSKLSGESVSSPSNQSQARKRSNSRDLASRTALTTDHRRLPKTPPAASTGASTTPSNSVFVRAVVARGNSTGGRSAETRITNDGHVDKRAKGDDRAAVLALTDAEAVRRHILADVKKISIERIVADAKRLQYLEDLHRRQHESTGSQQRTSVPAQNGGDGVTKSTSKTNHAV